MKKCMRAICFAFLIFTNFNIPSYAFSPSEPFTYVKSSGNGHYFSRVVGNRKNKYLDLFVVLSENNNKHLFRLEKFYVFPEELTISDSQTVIRNHRFLGCNFEYQKHCIPNSNDDALIFYGFDKKSLLTRSKGKIIKKYYIKDLLFDNNKIIESNILRGMYIWYKSIDIKHGLLHITFIDGMELYFNTRTGEKIEKLPEYYIHS